MKTGDYFISYNGNFIYKILVIDHFNNEILLKDVTNNKIQVTRLKLVEFEKLRFTPLNQKMAKLLYE